MPAVKEPAAATTAPAAAPKKKSAAKKIVAPPKPQQLTAPKMDDILYPDLEIKQFHSGPGGEGPLTEEMVRKLMHVETEEEWQARWKAANPSATEVPTFDSVVDEDGSPAPIDWVEDVEGNKLVAWANLNNRPLDLDWVRTLAQVQLKRQWAGPTTMPGETVNGEPILISRRGLTESIQHRGFALIFANQMLKKDPLKWSKYWPDGRVVIDTLAVFGISDDPKVVQSLDNTRARSEADVFSTGPLFQGLPRDKRIELSRYLANAVDLAWVRVGAGQSNGDKVYKSRPEVTDFVNRHQKLLTCVKHCYEENQERALSLLKLSTGQLATLMYLMATSESDPAKYKKAKPDVRGDKQLDFSTWDKAEEFIVMLAQQGTEDAVRKALNLLVDPDDGTPGRTVEKFAVLCKAWKIFKEGNEPSLADCQLTKDDYEADKDGVLHLKLDALSNFGGIDVGDKRPGFKAEEELSEEEVKANIRQANIDYLKNKLAKTKGGKGADSPETVKEAAKKAAEAAAE